MYKSVSRSSSQSSSGRRKGYSFYLVTLCAVIFVFSQAYVVLTLTLGDSSSPKASDATYSTKIEASILFPNVTDHSLRVDIREIVPCSNAKKYRLFVNENGYYTHLLSVAEGKWFYYQLCLEDHYGVDPHVVEIYTGNDRNEDSQRHDCDLFISTNDVLPNENNYDFKSALVGNDHIKLPKDQADNSYRSISIGVLGKGVDNKCHLTIKVNTEESESFIGKFNLRRNQIFIPHGEDSSLNYKQLALQITESLNTNINLAKVTLRIELRSHTV